MMKAGLLFAEMFSAAPPLRVVSQNTLLISHPFSDDHLAIERAILSLPANEELQNRIPTKVATGPSQSLAWDFPTSRSFYILLSQMTHGLQIVYTPPLWFISIDYRSLCLKVTLVHLLD